MASTELTISKGSDGHWNMSDVRMFMKDIGTTRSACAPLRSFLRLRCWYHNMHRRVNAVERLYASFPFFLFISITYAGQLLVPLLESQMFVPNSQPYAMKDLGELNSKCFIFHLLPFRVSRSSISSG